MTLPSIDDLSPDELRALISLASSRLEQDQRDAEQERETIRGSLPDIHADLDAEKQRLQAVLDTPNQTIKADPQVQIIRTARATLRAIDAIQSALRLQSPNP